MILGPVLRQLGISSVETRLVSHEAVVSGRRIYGARIEDIGERGELLLTGVLLPVGSVEFIRAAFPYANILEPLNLSYPDCLRPFLHRRIEQTSASAVKSRRFVKPMSTKAFTGFVFDPDMPPALQSEHDSEQSTAFLALTPHTPVWAGDEVAWGAEVRYYISDGQILGEGRYDAGPDDARLPDRREVERMVAAMTASGVAPRAYGIDAGVLANGETALVECNDAWALGYYRGSLSHKDYVAMLFRRWQQLYEENLSRVGWKG